MTQVAEFLLPDRLGFIRNLPFEETTLESSRAHAFQLLADDLGELRQAPESRLRRPKSLPSIPLL